MEVKDESEFKDEISKRMAKEVEVQEKDLTKESIYETLLKTNSFSALKELVFSKVSYMDSLVRSFS